MENCENCIDCQCESEDWEDSFENKLNEFEAKLKKEGWELVGNCDVDSGTIMIGDPCYTMPDEICWGEKKGDMEIKETYSSLFDNNVDFENGHSVWEVKHKPGHTGAGVIMSAGFGDGTYPVYVRRENGRVREARIIFIPEFQEVDW